MATRRNWTEEEQRIICRCWLQLLDAQRGEQKANKAALCRATLPLLNERSRGSYELKMMNVSAAAKALGWPETVNGYKPAGHAQKSLAAILKDEADRFYFHNAPKD